jgi:predicted nucleic acid-binding protein
VPPGKSTKHSGTSALVIIDASAVINQLIGGDAAADIERHTAYGAEDLHAPHVLDLEVLSVLRRASSSELVADFLDFPIERYPHTLLVPRIWELRHNFTVFDASYVALAEALDESVPLLTSDKRLAKAVRKHTDVEVLLAA